MKEISKLKLLDDTDEMYFLKSKEEKDSENSFLFEIYQEIDRQLEEQDYDDYFWKEIEEFNLKYSQRFDNLDDNETHNTQPRGY